MPLQIFVVLKGLPVENYKKHAIFQSGLTACSLSFMYIRQIIYYDNSLDGIETTTATDLYGKIVSRIR